MTFTQPEQRVRTGARRVRVERAVPMKAAAIIAALGIALVVTMGPAPASAQTTVIRECGDHYLVTHYNSDGSVKGVHNKQLSDEGTIYTAGKTWTLVEGSPDRFVSDGGAQLQVIACDATPGSGTRGIGVRQVQGTQTSTTLVSNTGQPQSTDFFVSADVAQPFTTGSNAGGYRLTGVQWVLGILSGTPPGFSVSIHEDSSGLPGSRLGAALTMTGSLSNLSSPVQFTASGGRDLGAGKTYWVVLAVQASNPQFVTRSTTSFAEDQAAAGWSIGNERRFRTLGTTSWPVGSKVTTSAHPIAIEGYAKPEPTLVSAEVNGTSLVLTYDKDLNTASRTAARQFGIRFGGGALQRATAISISGRQVTLTVPEVRSGQVVTVSYTVPTRNPLKDSSGVEAAAFSDQAVTVNTGPAYGRSATGKVRTAVYVTYTNADGEEVTVENRAASADRETILDYFEDECGRTGQGDRFDSDGNCASHKLYVRQQSCASENWRLWNPHLLDTWCPDDRTW